MVSKNIEKRVTGTCKRPPAGWLCSREANHDGPCAASEDPSDYFKGVPSELHPAVYDLIKNNQGKLEPLKQVLTYLVRTLSDLCVETNARYCMENEMSRQASAMKRDELTKEQKRERLGRIAYQTFYDKPGVLHIDWDKSWRGAGEEGRERWCRVGQAIAEELKEKP